MVVVVAASLMSLSAFESGDESVGERRGMEERRGGGRETVESDIETKFEGTRLERMRGMGFKASAAEEAKSRGFRG